MFPNKLRFDTLLPKFGQKLALKIETVIALVLFKQKQDIATKKLLYQIFEPDCSYKTLVVSLNRWTPLAALILRLILKINKQSAHLIKHLDSTDIPVCRFKNASAHKTRRVLAAFGRTSLGMFYGLKLLILADLCQKLLSLKFTPAKVDDRKVVRDLSQGLSGIFVADAGYPSKKLASEFYQEKPLRFLLAQARANMKKLMTKWQERLYQTRMRMETNFRVVKCFYGLITSLPRSVNGYLANYIYSLLAYQLA